MTTATCATCRQPFERDSVDTWKRFCLSCWRASREPNPRDCRGDGASGIDPRIRSRDLKILKLQLEVGALQEELLKTKFAMTVSRPRASPLLTYDNLRALRRLCHPDRHGGSEAANRISKIINEELQRPI